MVRATGRFVLGVAGWLGALALFAARAIARARRAPSSASRLVRALAEQGVHCVPVVLLVGLFTGLVLGLQGHQLLGRFGPESSLGSLVGLALTRELGPVLAALVLVGQAGSAVAAELGVQRITEQVDALDTMGINTPGYLVAPRLLAALIVFPLLTAGFVLIGFIGGWASASWGAFVDDQVYWSSVFRAVGPAAIVECLLKAVTFGGVTTAICTYCGFRVDRTADAVGARAVSTATTRAVVLSSVAILVCDYLLTSFFV